MHEEKTVDSSGRRLRFAPPVDDGKRLEPGEADYLILEWLDDHGPMPTRYLYEAAKHLRQNYTFHQKRLEKLHSRHNTPHGGPYLYRPGGQKHVYRADRQDITHDLTPIGKEAVFARTGMLYPKRIDPMHHRFMNACCTASIRLAAQEAGLEYVRLKDILGRHTCPQETREAKNPLALKTAKGVLIPDDLFGLAYPGEKKRTFRFLAVEDDRATETLDLIEQKFECYLDAMRKHLYEGHWGIPNLMVLVITTRNLRKQNMLDLLEELTAKDPELRELFLFKVRPEFAEEWLTPPVMKDLLMEPWERAGLEPLYLDRA